MMGLELHGRALPGRRQALVPSPVLGKREGVREGSEGSAGKPYGTSGPCTHEITVICSPCTPQAAQWRCGLWPCAGDTGRSSGHWSQQGWRMQWAVRRVACAVMDARCPSHHLSLSSVSSGLQMSELLLVTTLASLGFRLLFS